MKKLLSILLLTSFSLASYAGGHAMSDNGHSAMSSAKSSSGVHFYGRMYVGYDDRQVGSGSEIGRAHVRTPVTSLSRMPSSA